MIRSHREASTVVDVLRASAEAGAEVEAYVEYEGPDPSLSNSRGDSRRSLTFGGLDAAADSVAAALADRGVRKGDVVALVLPSSIDYAVCYHAALRLGAVTSGVNPRLGTAERTSIFGRLGAAVTVTDGTVPVETMAVGGHVLERSEVAAAVTEAAAGRGRPLAGSPEARSVGSGRDRLDGRVDRDTEGRPVRPRQPACGRRRDRRAVGSSATAAYRPSRSPTSAT